MSERKLLVGPDPTGATFAAGFRSAAKLPTEEQTKQAMEQTFAEMRKELHRPEYQPPSFGGPHVAGRNGWLNEQPLVNADTDRANELIEGICNAGLPQPGPAVARARPSLGAAGMVLALENPPETGTEPLPSMFPEVAGRRRTNGERNEANSMDRTGRSPVNGRDCVCHGSKWSCHWRISAGAVEPQSLRLLWLLRAT